jgi:probable O-glycosylation ligase (exosortase A-associated)
VQYVGDSYAAPPGQHGGPFAERKASAIHVDGRRLRVLRSLFILSILVPGFIAALRSRYAALLMYLWFALFRPQDWMWFDITNLRLSLVFGVLLIVPALLSGRFPNVTHPLSAGMVLFLAASLVSQSTAVQPALGWEWIDFLVRLFLACTLLVTLASDAPRLIGVVAVVSGSLGFHAGKAGLAYVIGGGTRFADGLSGAFVDNNGYALGTVMILPLLLATAQNADLVCRQIAPVIKIGPELLTRWAKRAFYIAIPFCVIAVIGTYSRGGFLALSASMLMLLMLQRRRFMGIVVLLTVVTVVLIVVPIPQSYLDRMQTIRTYEEVGEESALSRPHFWKVGVRMALARPFGVGLRQYEQAYDRYDFSFGRFGFKRAVHSAHVQVLAELGVFGALVWSGLFGYAAWICLRVRARSRNEHLRPDAQRFLFTTSNALLVSMTGFVIGGAFLALALNDLTWLTFGMVGALDRISRQMCEQVDPVLTRARVAAVPLAFRAVESYASVRGGRA